MQEIDCSAQNNRKYHKKHLFSFERKKINAIILLGDFLQSKKSKMIQMIKGGFYETHMG